MNDLPEIQKDIEPMPEQSVDPGLYRIALFFLGTVAVVSVVGTLALAFLGQSAPEGVLTIGAVATGAFATMLKPREG